jgi:cell division protease FtsH
MNEPQKNTKSPRPKIPMKWVLIWLFIIFGVLVLLQVQNSRQGGTVPVSQSDIVSDLESGYIDIQKTVLKGTTLEGKYLDNIPDQTKAGKKFAIDAPTGDWFSELVVNKYGITYRHQSDFLPALLSSLLPLLLFIGLIWFLISRQMKNAGGGALSFGKSRAKMLTKDRNKVTFNDVAGVQEAKEELCEIIEFLSDPKKFQKLGGRIPKGVLLVGPPGTGKTLLAKSVAGEADVPFFTISGSDFVEMFVGVGASRVRDLFEQGKRNAPCIIFMDEIDAVGRYRGAGIGGGHDEREQTLNALLVEMDGFDTKEGVILVAATNRPDVLDPALLRSGRFDRQIVIDLPDLNGREAILDIHAKKIKLDDSVSLRETARGTPGFTGADLANLINEAALLGARLDKKAVGMPELEEARDKVRWGRERRSRVIGDKERRITAYHEAGHALVLYKLESAEPLHKVTIIPRGQAYLGATMQLPKADKYLNSKTELLDQITGSMGGRIAEKMIFDEISSGASSDLRSATKIARAMVCELGMSEKMGPMTFGEKEEMIFLGKEIARHSEYSQTTALEIDQEVRAIIKSCYAKATEILKEHKDHLVSIAEALLENEALDGEDVTAIIEGTWEGISRKKQREQEEEEEKKEEEAAREENGPEESSAEADEPGPEEQEQKAQTEPPEEETGRQTE